jgi:7-cyano-7-deazaguanine reductase
VQHAVAAKLAKSNWIHLLQHSRADSQISRFFETKAVVRYNSYMSEQPRYTLEHAKAGLDTKFPEIETWPNQFPGYEIVIDDPEFTSVCPKTGLPDFGVITLRYMPDKLCLELKSYKEYLQSYRNKGIFQENVVNRVLDDVVRWAKPVWAEVKGDFRPRGGISTVVVAKWPRPKANHNLKRHA